MLLIIKVARFLLVRISFIGIITPLYSGILNLSDYTHQLREERNPCIGFLFSISISCHVIRIQVQHIQHHIDF